MFNINYTIIHRQNVILLLYLLILSGIRMSEDSAFSRTESVVDQSSTTHSVYTGWPKNWHTLFCTP